MSLEQLPADPSAVVLAHRLSTPNRPGGRSAAPGHDGVATAEQRGRRRLLQRVRESVWAPIALKAAAIGIGMLALAGIGAASIVASANGVPLASAGSAQRALELRTDIGQVWLEPSPPERPGSAAAQEHEPQSEPRSQTEHAQTSKSCGSDGPCQADAGAASGAGVTADGKVILNTAGVDELTRLPGVGRKRAAAILALRTRLKRFRRPTDLLRVRGIGAKSLRRMLPHLVLDPPQPTADAGGADGAR